MITPDKNDYYIGDERRAQSAVERKILRLTRIIQAGKLVGGYDGSAANSGRHMRKKWRGSWGLVFARPNPSFCLSACVVNSSIFYIAV